MAALFEFDNTQIPERIKRAEQLIAARDRELFHQTTDRAEQRSLNAAMHALHALKRCLKP